VDKYQGSEYTHGCFNVTVDDMGSDKQIICPMIRFQSQLLHVLVQSLHFTDLSSLSKSIKKGIDGMDVRCQPKCGADSFKCLICTVHIPNICTTLQHRIYCCQRYRSSTRMNLSQLVVCLSTPVCTSCQ
jgi:hypothetical protein